MGFNYGLEKKNFDSQWAVTRKQYEEAGMSSEAIQAMYDYDWSVFNATRAYQNHTQEIAAPSFEQRRILLTLDEQVSGSYFRYGPLLRN